MTSPLSPYTDILEVRREILEGEGLLDMVDLVHAGAPAAAANKRGRKRLADRTPVSEALSNASAFFELTYPTDDVTQTLYALARRLDVPHAVAGTILLSGGYGLGKSHVLLAAHHALRDPGAAAKWAERWGLEPLELRGEHRVVTRSFIEKTSENLWQVFFDAVGKPELSAAVTTYPDGQQIQSLLDERHTFLIFDELERWYDALSPEMRSRNRNFLQALTEVASRDARVTLVTSVLREEPEPGETLRRVRPLELAFRSDSDRQQILLFRLFEQHDRRDRARIEEVVDTYCDAYARAGLDGLDKYRQRMVDTYPFTPEFLDILTQKVPNLGGFQNTRGSLRFLSKVVQATAGKRPVLSSQDLPLSNNEMVRDLGNLDDTHGGEVVRRALGDNYKAVEATLPHKDELFSAILFYSIADPARPGATDGELMLAVLDPGENPNVIRDSLRQLHKVAFNLHHENARHVFRTQENPHARIHAVALSPQVTEQACRAIVRDVLESTWNAKDRTVVYAEGDTLDEVAKRLRARGTKRPLYLLSTVSLSPARRLELQNVNERRNLVLLIEPRFETEHSSSRRYDLCADRDLLMHARTIEACNRLLESNPADDSVYTEVLRERRGTLGRAISERYGQYVDWLRSGATDATVDASWYQLGQLDGLDASRFYEHFRRERTGLPHIEARVRELCDTYLRKPARALIDHFDKTPTEPVPLEEDMVDRALRALAEEGRIALQDQRGKEYCRKNVVELSRDDLPACVLVPAPPIAVPPDKPEPLPVHPFVTAHYDTTREAVVVRWTYPEIAGKSFRTLVQRHVEAQGWETGKERNIDLDRTHDDNRYLDVGDEHFDMDGLSPGARFYYYVFLVDDSVEPPRAILSQRCDVSIPPREAVQPADQIRIGRQPRYADLLAALERELYTSLTSESRVRKVEMQIYGARDIEAIDELATPLGAFGEAEVTADLSFVVRGKLDREQVMKAARTLPKLSAIYEAVLFLEESEG